MAPIASAGEVRRDEDPAPEDPRRQDRLRDSPLDHDEDRQQDCRAGEEHEALGRRPRPGDSAFEQREDQHRDRGGEHGRAGHVDPMAAALDMLMQVAVNEHDRRKPQRDVEEEDPAPRPVLGEEAADQGTDDRGHAPHARDVTLDPPPLRRLVQVSDDRRRHREDRACSDPLHAAEDDQREHAPGDAAEHRADEEDPDPEQQQRLPAEDVGEAPVDRHEHGLREQVDREEPGKLVEPTEVANDLRDRGRDDRGVDRRQADREEQRRDDQPARAGRDLLGQRPRRSSIASSRRQRGRTFTLRSRKTERPRSASISGRASVPIWRTIEPPLPTRICFCESVST